METEILPAGNTVAPATAPVAPEPTPSAIENIDSAIAKSKSEIHEAHAPKKRRGRKPIHGKYSKYKEEAAPGSAPNAGADPAAGPSVDTPELDLSPILGQIIKTPFQIFAQRLKCPAIELTESEVKDPAALASQLVHLYAPEVMKQDPKTIVLYSFAASIAMLSYSKLNIYQATIAENQPAATTETPATGNSEIPFPIITPDQVFRRPLSGLNV